MQFKNYETVSDEVRRQIDGVTDIWKNRLGDSLVGVYLQGSIALNCFIEESSDIDMLVVISRKLPRAERLEIAGDILKLHMQPSPIELSAIYSGDINPWRHPAICQFHFSEYWAERYRKTISGEQRECYLADVDFPDGDIACHARLTRQSGILLYGAPIADAIPEVPEADFWDSLTADIDDYDFNAYSPEYFASNILILARVLSYKAVGRILSEYDSAIWAQSALPERFSPIIKAATAHWFERAPMPDLAEDALEDFRNYLITEIRR